MTLKEASHKMRGPKYCTKFIGHGHTLPGFCAPLPHWGHAADLDRTTC